MTSEILQEQEFDSYKDDYSDDINKSLAFAGQEHDFYIRLKAEHLLAFVEKTYPNQTIKALDIGCGHGLMHKFLDVPSLNLHGCDPASTVIKEAQDKNKHVTYTSNDGETLPYDADSFDIVFMTGVMHHVPPKQWEGFLEEARRVIKPGGHIVIYEHNPRNPATYYIVKTCPIDENAVMLTCSKMKSLLRKMRYSNISREFIIFFPLDNKLARSTERALTWLPLGAQYVAIAQKQ